MLVQRVPRVEQTVDRHYFLGMKANVVVHDARERHETFEVERRDDSARPGVTSNVVELVNVDRVGAIRHDLVHPRLTTFHRVLRYAFVGGHNQVSHEVEVPFWVLELDVVVINEQLQHLHSHKLVRVLPRLQIRPQNGDDFSVEHM